MTNNEGVFQNPNVAPGNEHAILIAHDVNRPNRKYLSPNFCDFNPSIPYLVFDDNARYEMNSIIF